jgi:hypothetical protein
MNKFMENLYEALRIVTDAQMQARYSGRDEDEFLLWRVASAIQRRINDNDPWR